ncbi:MAG: lipid-A-disaccharide synthase [Cellvibrio sp.]|uniref:lipid-A-disaccharide synthase n=1 Tax=Cellvibrio sp. TaxID=1965322 RepID=UPI00271AE89B|nr:lipid-A-disaccharide synthase [Cellvibrio sp.]
MRVTPDSINPMNAAPQFSLVAGEASGDLLAGLLLDGLRARWPQMRASGIGGPRMAERGFDAWWPSDKLSVFGYVDALCHYREILGIRNQLKAKLLQEPPGVFIGVDAPDFNLDLEADLRAKGIKTVHFVCPSIWAWRPGRVEKLKKSCDHVLCVFPFEPELLAKHGIAATFVGHPLASVIPMQSDKASARARLGLQLKDRVVAVLPGSRLAEIKHLAPRFFKAVAGMVIACPAMKFIVPSMPKHLPLLQKMAQECGVEKHVQILSGQSHTALEACDVTLIASGTATLEAALFKRPMVIAYALNWLSYEIMKRKKLQPWVGLPNILCQDFVVPELLQHEATPQALADATLAWFDAPEKIASLERQFTLLHTQLLRNTSELAAHAIDQVINQTA